MFRARDRGSSRRARQKQRLRWRVLPSSARAARPAAAGCGKRRSLDRRAARARSPISNAHSARRPACRRPRTPARDHDAPDATQRYRLPGSATGSRDTSSTSAPPSGSRSRRSAHPRGWSSSARGIRAARLPAMPSGSGLPARPRYRRDVGPAQPGRGVPARASSSRNRSQRKCRGADRHRSKANRPPAFRWASPTPRSAARTARVRAALDRTTTRGSMRSAAASCRSLSIRPRQQALPHTTTGRRRRQCLRGDRDCKSVRGRGSQTSGCHLLAPDSRSTIGRLAFSGHAIAQKDDVSIARLHAGKQIVAVDHLEHVAQQAPLDAVLCERLQQASRASPRPTRPFVLRGRFRRPARRCAGKSTCPSHKLWPRLPTTTERTPTGSVSIAAS